MQDFVHQPYESLEPKGNQGASGVSVLASLGKRGRAPTKKSWNGLQRRGQTLLGFRDLGSGF